MLFQSFPDSARLWVFSLNGPVTNADKLKLELDNFVSQWKAHGSPLKAGVEIIDLQVLLVAADESVASASGCSIDALSREISRLASEAQLAVCGGGEVVFKVGEIWKAVSRAEFQKLIALGEIDLTTKVVDATLTSIAELRVKGVVKAVSDSWHSKAFEF